MGTSSAELLLTLDRSRPRALRAQIEEELREAIRAGRVLPGTPLPSTRALAQDLGVTRGVVVDAYDQLIAEGYLAARPGSGTTVNQPPDPARGAPAVPPATVPVEIDFRPGLPDLARFPAAAWSRATRAALGAMPAGDLGYTDPRGLPVLRQALAEYLARVRGVSSSADQIVVCSGFGHGVSLVTGALTAAGIGEVAVEDPGYDGTREVLTHAGVGLRPVPVDDEGLVVDSLRRTGVRAVVVTPAHQSPTGVVLSPDRRRQLAGWAAAVDGYVLEDDYDAEYRYDRRPVGALQGIAPDRVVYSGTLSKSLAPGLRLGWLVVPPSVVEPIVAARRATDGSTSTILQATCAAFLANGDLDRHLRRTRRAYRRRRDALIAALARWLPDAVPTGVAAGLNVLVLLPDDIDEAAAVDRALAAGVRVYPLANYRASASRRPRQAAVVLGYGALSEEQVERGVRLLADAISTLR